MATLAGRDGGGPNNTTVNRLGPRVSFETSFDSKQPKLEPKLVSALSETKRLFRLFRFYTEITSFGISIKPKQTEDQPKQFEREHYSILVFFIKCNLLSYVVPV